MQWRRSFSLWIWWSFFTAMVVVFFYVNTCGLFLRDCGGLFHSECRGLCKRNDSGLFHSESGGIFSLWWEWSFFIATVVVFFSLIVVVSFTLNVVEVVTVMGVVFFTTIVVVFVLPWSFSSSVSPHSKKNSAWPTLTTFLYNINTDCRGLIVIFKLGFAFFSPTVVVFVAMVSSISFIHFFCSPASPLSVHRAVHEWSRSKERKSDPVVFFLPSLIQKNFFFKSHIFFFSPSQLHFSTIWQSFGIELWPWKGPLGWDEVKEESGQDTS